MNSPPGDRVIAVLEFEALDYATGLSLQERLVALRQEERIGDVLLLLEHTPVITFGRNAKAKNLLASAQVLEERGVAVFECNRGGDVTFHGPGQLVAYPIFDLRGFPSPSSRRTTLGVIDFVRYLEEAVIRTCAEFGIPAKRIPGLTGVWTAGGGLSQAGEMPEAKIAALGVHIARGVSSHGLALNVNTDLSFFNLIVPCGISAKPVTSMANELRRALSLADVASALARHFGVVFSRPIVFHESLDALLGATLGIPMRVPENLRKIHGQDEFRPA
jgi:lipoyl(octanoyl) transferase